MKRVLMTAACALALVGASAGVTAAMTTSTSTKPAVVHAYYYNNNTHALHFSASTAHPSGTTAISWLKRGTAGPTGIDVVGMAVNNAAGVNSVSLNCPSNHPYLISGGGGGSYPEMLVYDGPHSMGRGWQVIVHDSNGNYPAESIYVNLFCAK